MLYRFVSKDSTPAWRYRRAVTDNPPQRCARITERAIANSRVER
jgi:hypothetical protein